MRRRFGAPAFDPGREELVLRLDDVPGLASAWLNGERLCGPESQGDLREFSLAGRLERRNELELEVDPAAWEGTGAEARAWGSVALVIKAADG